METPNYIKSLLMPNGKKPAGRKVWSIDLETVWLPFFTATNTNGETHIAPDALGSPLRLAYDADGSVKSGQHKRWTLFLWLHSDSVPQWPEYTFTWWLQLRLWWPLIYFYRGWIKWEGT